MANYSNRKTPTVIFAWERLHYYDISIDLHEKVTGKKLQTPRLEVDIFEGDNKCVLILLTYNE
jgi:hypothetical protein